MPTSSVVVSTASATSTPTQGSGGGSPNSPLLFFVALGFGVVFTNLWIIVGVKYCFRYNARNRARANGEEDENVDLQAMPRPRRRREKKLMTMDEVNERFPLIKYKAWRMAREKEGLSPAGGVTAPPSRAGSIKHVDTEDTTAAGAVTADLPSSEFKKLNVEIDSSPITVSTLQSPAMAHLEPKSPGEGVDRDSFAAKHLSDASLADNANLSDFDKRESQAHLVSDGHRRNESTDDDDDDDEDHIHTAVPPELLTTPGDSCAICIDVLEDDEDVRGLTCGHAFHASCLDPWLTGRRACCPLCKADYYIPKPRPEGEAAAEQSQRTRTRNAPQRIAPVNAQPWASRSLRNPRHFFPPRGTEEDARNNRDNQRRGTSRRAGNDSFLAFEARRRAAAPPQQSPNTENTERRGFHLRNPFAGLRSGRRNNDNTTNPDAATTVAPPASTPSLPVAEVTPGQLEAGTR